jgi:hypothetical protein
MADKANMKCNHPVASDRPGKKKMVKACSNGEEKLLHFGAKSSLNGKMSFLKGNVKSNKI